MITVEPTTRSPWLFLWPWRYKYSLQVCCYKNVCSNSIGNWILIPRSSRYKYSFVRTPRLSSNSCCRNTEVSNQISRILDDACKNKLAVVSIATMRQAWGRQYSLQVCYYSNVYMYQFQFSGQLDPYHVPMEWILIDLILEMYMLSTVQICCYKSMQKEHVQIEWAVGS